MYKKKTSNDSKYSKSGKGKKYRNNRAPRTSQDVREEVEADTPNRNDPSWYAHYPQLLKDAGSISFSMPVGNNIDLTGFDQSTTDLGFNPHTTAAYVNALYDIASPGIAALRYVPTIGVSNSFTSPINVAARNIYTFIRHANSGHSNYEAPDLMMYLLAMDSVYAYYAFLVRLYGVLQLYTPMNKYYPKGLVTAMGVKFEDVISQSATLRYYINMFAAKMGSLCIPSMMNMSKRHQWMNMNLFTDSPSQKAQTYLFVPTGFYLYDDQSLETGTSLKYTNITCADTVTGLSTLDELTSFGDSLIQGLMSSEDAGIMSGDILKAFTSSGIFKIGEVPEDFHIVPTYSLEVLTQIQNAIMLPQIATLDITQDPNTQSILQTPTCMTSKFHLPVYNANYLLNVPVDNPTPETVMVSTRLMPYTKPAASPVGKITIESSGTELLMAMKIFWYSKSTDSFKSTMFQYCNDAESCGCTGYDASATISRLNSFAYHPCVHVIYTYGTDTVAANNKHILKLQDLDNYTILSRNDLARMHEVALQSEIAVDQATKAVQ